MGQRQRISPSLAASTAWQQQAQQPQQQPHACVSKTAPVTFLPMHGTAAGALVNTSMGLLLVLELVLVLVLVLVPVLTACRRCTAAAIQGGPWWQRAAGMQTSATVTASRWSPSTVWAVMRRLGRKLNPSAPKGVLGRFRDHLACLHHCSLKRCRCISYGVLYGEVTWLASVRSLLGPPFLLLYFTYGCH
jgi:hypothetical protein